MLFALDAVLSCLVTAAVCLAAGVSLGTIVLTFLVSYVVIAVLIFLFLCVCCATVDLETPQQEDSPFFRRLIKPYIRAIFVLLRMDIHTEGLDQLPKDGRFLLVCNHLFDLDPVVLLGYFPNAQLAFISKKENKTMFLVGKIMHRILCQMIDRENDREALKTILKCISLIKEDKASIGVFPEGYTSLDGKLQPFRPGVFKIAQKTKVPIVVCTLKNTEKVFHNAKRLKKTDVHLHLVGVVEPESFADKTTVALSEEIHEMMLSDLGPEYARTENA